MTVYFIGAGPGDPELITVKGQRLVRTCPVILYAGSLVPPAVLDGHRAEQVVNTAELDLDAIVALLADAHAKGRTSRACIRAIRRCTARSANRSAG